VPHNTAVLTCESTEVVCPGNLPQQGNAILPPPKGRSYYYLFTHDPNKTAVGKVKGVPQLTGSDLKRSGTRQDFDPTTNEPVVLMQFTGSGSHKFQQVTSEAYNRGHNRNGSPTAFRDRARPRDQVVSPDRPDEFGPRGRDQWQRRDQRHWIKARGTAPRGRSSDRCPPRQFHSGALGTAYLTRAGNSRDDAGQFFWGGRRGNIAPVSLAFWPLLAKLALKEHPVRQLWLLPLSFTMGRPAKTLLERVLAEAFGPTATGAC